MIESPNRINIDLSALKHNLNQVKKLVGQKTKIMGMVKSDAYGHGILPVSRVLERDGVDYLGAAHVVEALEIRRGGIKVPIAVLFGIRTREEATAIVETELTPVLFDVAAFEVLARESAKKGKKTPVHVKVDTGMGRLGIPHWEIGAFLERVMKFEALHVNGLFSHLSSADDLDNGFTETQIEHFKKAIEIGRALGLELPMNSLANSAGVMAHKDSHFDLVRPGIMLYGGLPSPRFPRLVPLKPVMRFSGQIIQVRDFPDHTPIGYGQTYHTRGSQKAAVLSAGYGDGLFRSMSNRGKVLIGGEKVDLIGRISMNMAVCEVSGLKGVTPGTEAVFLGAQGKETITGNDMADWAETVSYEIFCSIGIGRNREYRG